MLSKFDMKMISLYGMMNIGIRPTFHNPTPQEQLEVHLFEREVDLYGKELEVEFLIIYVKNKNFRPKRLWSCSLSKINEMPIHG